MLQGQQAMSNFWNCICQPAQAKYAIDELLRQVRSPPIPMGAPGPEPLGPSRPVLSPLPPPAPARTRAPRPGPSPPLPPRSPLTRPRCVSHGLPEYRSLVRGGNCS